MAVVVPIDPAVAEQVKPNIVNVAYLVSRFPKLSETFVLYEFLALRSNPQLSLKLTLFAMKEEREPLRHADASKLMPEVVYRSPLDVRTWGQAVAMAVSSPWKTLCAIGSVCRHNLASPRFLLTSIVALPSALAMAREMTQRDISHIHAHFANVATTTAYLVNALTGITFSFTAHGSDLHRDQTMLAEKIAAARSAITVSAFNARVMREHSPSELHHKIEVINCGADLDTFRPDPDRLSVRLTPQPLTRVRIGCLGTLLPVKGQRYLLQALGQLAVDRKAALQDGALTLSCTLIGDGPERAALEALVTSLGLGVVGVDTQSTDAVSDSVAEIGVEFAGSLAREQVAARLKEFDIIVVPSVPTTDGRKEGIPVSLMEAMASGAAIVASDLTGIPELVIDEKTGLLASPGDSQKLALSIMRLIDDGELRARCIKAGRELVASEFDLRRNAYKVARRFDGIPAEVLEGKDVVSL